MGIASNLVEKKVIVFSTEPAHVQFIVKELQREGAAVIKGEKSPHHSANVPAILEEIGREAPDAVLIHHPNLGSEGSAAAVRQIIDEIGGKIPVVIQDTSRAELSAVNDLSQRGIKCLNSMVTNAQETAFHIGGAIAQHGRSGGRAAGA